MRKRCLMLLVMIAFFYSCKPAETPPTDTAATETTATEATTTTATEPAATTATPPYPQIVQQANQIFQQSLPGAFTFTATGMPQSGVATSPSQLVTWVFIATTNSGGFRQLVFENGQFGQPTTIGGWVGVAFTPLPQGTIQLQQAIDILNQKGFTQGFTSVSMGTPVVQNPQPMYWFCVNGQTQGVSASTGEFFPNLFPCRGTGAIQLATKP
jgi:hypothetical protein